MYFYYFLCNISEMVWTTLSLPIILNNPNFIPFYLTIQNKPLSVFVFKQFLNSTPQLSTPLFSNTLPPPSHPPSIESFA